MFQLAYEDIVDGFKLAGNWNADFFQNKNNIVLELGCGKGNILLVWHKCFLKIILLA